VLKIYHAPRTRSVRIIWMLEEMGLDYEVIKTAFPVTDPEFLVINPTGTFPLFVDGEVRLTESIAILQYLAARYGPTPMSVKADEPGFADYLQFLEVGEATLATPLTVAVRTRFMAPEDQKANWTAESCKSVFLDRLQLVNSQLKTKAFMAADRFTAADISVGYALGFGEGLRLAGGYDPVLVDYWRRLQARPAYQRALAR
jgi:glutathione S-transferase